MILPINVSRLVCWFRSDIGVYQDASLTTVAISDGDFVGGWADQSGNEFNAFQNISINRPVLRLNQLNNLPTIQFNSSLLQYLSLGTILGKPRAWSLFIVMMTNTPAVRQSPHGAYGIGSSSSWGNAVISQTGCAVGSSSPDFGDGVGNFSQVSTLGAIWNAGVYNYMCYVHRDNVPSFTITKNGAMQPLSALASQTAQCIGTAYDFCLGREGDSNGIYLNGNIAEFILYDINLLPSDRKNVELYLKTRWNL